MCKYMYQKFANTNIDQSLELSTHFGDCTFWQKILETRIWLASLPGSSAPEHKHWSYVGSSVLFLTSVTWRAEKGKWFKYQMLANIANTNIDDSIYIFWHKFLETRIRYRYMNSLHQWDTVQTATTISRTLLKVSSFFLSPSKSYSTWACFSLFSFLATNICLASSCINTCEHSYYSLVLTLHAKHMHTPHAHTACTPTHTHTAVFS